MQALYAQLLVGLINGSFYALLSLGLAVIFGMLNIINFAHGAVYMMGAFCAYFLLNVMGIGYWPALIIAPIAVGIFGMILERTMLQWLAGLDHLYGLLLTFGIALIVIIPVAIAYAIFYLIVVILAGVSASGGGGYRYPLTLRFVH